MASPPIGTGLATSSTAQLFCCLVDLLTRAWGLIGPSHSVIPASLHDGDRLPGAGLPGAEPVMDSCADHVKRQLVCLFDDAVSHLQLTRDALKVAVVLK